ncbi:acyl carrier protein [Spirillospora sp. NPDC049652]
MGRGCRGRPCGLDRHRRLEEFGVDSLMAAELITVLRNAYGLEIPPMEFVRNGGTIADMAQMVHLRLGPDPSPRAAPSQP